MATGHRSSVSSKQMLKPDTWSLGELVSIDAQMRPTCEIEKLK